MENSKNKKSRGITKLLVGTAALLALLFAASGGFIPIGGENCAIRNNINNKIDATPLFYTESEEVLRINTGTY